jgi:GAF domain-containing protein
LFAIGSTVPRTWNADDLALVQTFAERTRIAIERSRALKALQESDRHKNQILALLGHELRNPASPLATGISLLKRSATDGNSHTALALMERQVNQIHRLAEDLLGISYAYFGRLELRLEDLALNELIETVHWPRQLTTSRETLRSGTTRRTDPARIPHSAPSAP